MLKKTVCVIFVCFSILLLVGCNSVKKIEEHKKEISVHQIFSNDDLGTGFINYLQHISEEKLPNNSYLFLQDKNDTTSFDIYKIKLWFFDEFFKNNTSTLGFGSENTAYLFVKDKKIVALIMWEYPIWTLWPKNDQWIHDIYIRSRVNNSLYKNFQPILSGVLSFKINAATNILYTTRDFSGAVLLYKNNEVIYTWQQWETITIEDSHEKYGLLYGVYSSLWGEGYQDYHFQAYQENDSKPLFSWTGNFLIGDMYRITYDQSGGVVIWRSYNEYPNDIQESIPTITKNILNTVAQQEKTIVKRYRLIDQKRFEEAYQLLENPTFSLDEFKQYYQSLNMIDVDTIRNNLIYFTWYNTSWYWLYYNEFSVDLFQQTTTWFIYTNTDILSITDSQKVKIIEKWSYPNPPMFPNQEFVKTYYHYIATHRFEQAYQMQYDHPQTLDQFSHAYKDVIWIAFKEITEYPSNEISGQVELLLDFIQESDVDRYAIVKNIINSKLQHISSKKTTDLCVICPAYGYKPVIYLYPQKFLDIDVFLDLDWKFIVTYPQISNTNTRSVKAYPDGRLINNDDGKEYSYLFWEGELKLPSQIREGFVVKNEDTVAFLQEKLSYLWLNPKEYNEFIVYWWPLMKKNKRNVISFLEDTYTNQARLSIMPNPDSMQRIFMVFHWLDYPVNIQEQKLKSFTRSWFSVIERWWSEL